MYVFRCSIVGCYPTEDYLLEKEGVFLLIDLLQVSYGKSVCTFFTSTNIL